MAIEPYKVNVNIRSFVFASLTLTIGLAVAARQDEPSKLPIDVPKRAEVSFEAEGNGKQIFKTVTRLLNGNMSDPTAPSPVKLTIKTGLGNFDLDADDLGPIFEKINELHIVSYRALPDEDPFKHYERQFGEAGMSRVAFAPGEDGALIMRRNGPADQYGIVVRQKQNVLVLRSEGSPDIRSVGRALFEALSHAVQKAVKEKHR